MLFEPVSRGVLRRYVRDRLRAVGRVALVMALVVSGESVLTPTSAAAQPAPAQAPAPADAGPDEAADIPSAMATARLRGRRIEALSERSETSQTWVNPEGPAPRR